MQQKTEILIAIENGARTSQDLVDVTGMDRQKVAAYLCRLMAAGVTTTRCIGPAMREASRDPSKTADVVEKQPETCPHADCTAPNCKQAVADALRPMYRAWRDRARANGQGVV